MTIIKNIYNSWGTIVELSYDELMSLDSETYWKPLIHSRNLLVLRGISDSVLTDEEFYALGQKFGRVWDKTDFQRTDTSLGLDSTIKDIDSATPVSYFKSDNNPWKDGRMGYHADMPYLESKSFPGRILYMVHNTTDGSGATTWLNLEEAWEQFTDAEKSYFDDVQVAMHNMYNPNVGVELMPFLKANGNTGKLSPRMNSLSSPGLPGMQAWTHHVEKNGVELSFTDAVDLWTRTYALAEGKKDALYRHVWHDGDIIVYDNWFNVHRRDKVNDKSVASGMRELRRLTFNF